MSQTAFTLFLSVVFGMAICMAWRVAPEELHQKKIAEDWLKSEDMLAFHMRYNA
jgi:hypothetical protein